MIRAETAAEKKVAGKIDVRPVLKGLYPVALVIIANPLIDLVLGAFPPKSGHYDLQWRFGTIGILLKSLVVPFFGLGIATSIAAFLGQRRTLRAFGAFALLVGVLTLGCVMLFTLDYLQMRNNIVPVLVPPVRKAFISAFIIGAMMVPVALSLGLGAWKASRISGSSRPEAVRKKSDASLLVQTPPNPKESAT